jgi:hypothetical protein
MSEGEQTAGGSTSDPARGVGWLLAICVAAVNFAWVASDLGVLHPPNAVLETDHRRYIEMSKGRGNYDRPALAAERPFSQRIVVPALVRGATQVGVDRDVAFFALTQLCLVGFLYVVYRLLADHGLSLRWCAAGVVLAGSLPGAVRWYSYQYWMTDPLALLLVALAFLLIRRGSIAALFAVTVVGVATRETFLLVVPYFVLYRLRTCGFRDAVRVGLGLAAVAAGVVVLLQVAVPSLPGAPFGTLLAEVTRWRVANLFANQLYFATFGSFGVLLVLIGVAPERTRAHFATHWEDLAVVVAVYGSLLLARNTDRLLVYALPVLLPLAVANLRDRTARAGRFAPGVLLCVFAAQLVFYIETVTVGVPIISIRQPTQASVLVAMAVTAVVLVVTARPAVGAARLR